MDIATFHEDQFNKKVELDQPFYRGQRIHKGFVFETPELQHLASELEPEKFDEKVITTIFEELQRNLHQDNVIIIQRSLLGNISDCAERNFAARGQASMSCDVDHSQSGS